MRTPSLRSSQDEKSLSSRTAEYLTAQEVEALSPIKYGGKLARAMYQRLEMLDLVQESLCGWALMSEGDWRQGVGR